MYRGGRARMPVPAPAIARTLGNPYIRTGTSSQTSPPWKRLVSMFACDDETGLCVGCGRTVAEIASWTSLSVEQRRAIMAALPTRLQQLEDLKG